ncbi:hypothetical protein LCFBJUUZ_CDS0087 [Staphylococcus phage PG-2021_76]|uniref:Uncharacterized protein n=1 Tax=Mammaliicoccus phage MSShimriz1 TaxID=3230127 RepID=A0AAU8GT08_9VIRU
MDMKKELEKLLAEYNVQQGKIPLAGTVAEDNPGDTDYIYPVSVTEKDLIVFYVYNNEINVASSFTQNTIASGDNPISLDTLKIILETGLGGLIPLSISLED